jgi:hypothetical protein
MPETSEFFRAVNDRTRRVEGASVRVSEIVCECADERCAQTIRLRFDEYAALRSNPGQFAVVPGHERLGAEEVIARSLRYVVVRKRAAVA